MKKTYIALVTSLLLATPSGATLVTYEGFDYASGTNLDGLSGGTGWRFGWSNQNSAFPTLSNITAQTPGLSSGSLVVNGNMTTANTFDTTGRRLDNSFGGAWDSAGLMSDPFTIGDIDQGTVWGSLLIRRNAATASWDGGPHFNLHRSNTDWNTSSARSLQVLWDSTNNLWTANVNAGPSVNMSSTSVGNTALFVFKLELSTSGANNIYVWLNPADSLLGGSDPLTSTANASFTGLSSADARFRGFSFYGGGSVSDATSLDEIRFGTTFASVTPIPEPSTVAVLGLGLAGLALIRRRK